MVWTLAVGRFPDLAAEVARTGETAPGVLAAAAGTGEVGTAGAPQPASKMMIIKMKNVLLTKTIDIISSSRCAVFYHLESNLRKC